MNINDIKPYLKNAKNHPAKQVKLIAESIKRFGFDSPIIIDKNNEIIAGHGRLEAAKLLGLNEVPVIQKESLTPEEVKAYRLADNKISESEWDMGLAIEDLKELDDDLFQITGFDKDLLIEPDEKDDIIPDNAPTVAKLGDIWQLGRYRIMCGDSTKSEAVLRLMDGKKADMVFTDPPYNVAYHGMQNSKQWDELENDNLTDEQFIEFLNGAFSNYFNSTKEDCAFYICHADKSQISFLKSINNNRLHWRATIIWVKNTPSYSFAQYKYHHEPIFYCFKEGKTVKWLGDRTKTTIWRENWDDKKIIDWYKKRTKNDNQKTIWEAKKEIGLHPTIKPIELINRALMNSSEIDDLILDLFLGSGSTLIACEKTNRICYGMEIDPKYVDVIIKRWEDYTGQKAVKTA